jgi:AcrR family transcriptional regulator
MDHTRRSQGRPRSSSVQQLILEAAFQVLAERGYSGFTFEAVAKAAGAGKTTIYRWWPSKADLAVEAFFEATQAELKFPQTGLAKEDFRLQIMDLASLLAGSRGSVFAAMLGGARNDPDLAKALGERWLEPRRQWGYGRLAKASTDGETQPDIDIAAALGILYGPLYTPLLFGQDVPSKKQVEAHLQLALKSIFKST